jgi:hypothetical protein
MKGFLIYLKMRTGRQLLYVPYSNVLLSLFATLVFISCESLVGTVPLSKLPAVTSKLVVHSYISPQDTVLYVIVTESVPVFGIDNPDGTGKVIENARVTLSDGNTTVQLVFDPANRLYGVSASALPVVPGKTYTLVVKDQTREVSASTVVPKETVIISSYMIDTVTVRRGTFSDYPPDTLVAFRFSWKDLPGMRNYYRTRSSVNIADGMEQLDRNGRVVRQEHSYTQKLTGDLQSDFNSDGLTISNEEVRFSLSNFNGITSGSATYPRYYRRVNYIDMELSHASKSYYDYHRAMYSSGDSDDNPFVEPGIIYTNIEGGLGNFSSHNRFTMRVRFGDKK